MTDHFFNGFIDELEKIAARNPKLGSGGRFEHLERSIAAKKNSKIRDPKALAAAIGRKKYGNKRFQAMSAAGHAKHAGVYSWVKKKLFGKKTGAPPPVKKMPVKKTPMRTMGSGQKGLAAEGVFGATR